MCVFDPLVLCLDLRREDEVHKGLICIFKTVNSTQSQLTAEVTQTKFLLSGTEAEQQYADF